MAEQEAELPTRPSGLSGPVPETDHRIFCSGRQNFHYALSSKHATLKVMKKHLSLGISDFKKFIDENCYFVDKTHLIKYLIENPSKVHLITRPRRFGKTLNLSMVRYFFEAPYPGSDEPDNAYLFEGMSIASHPQCRQYLGQYPVIHLSLKNVKKSTYQDCMALVRNMLSDEYRRHEYLQNCGLSE